MSFEQIKKIWDENQNNDFYDFRYDQQTLKKIVVSRAKRHVNKAMQYFWAAFTLQIIVYSLFTHTMIRYLSDIQILMSSILGVVLFIPFTVILMIRFKKLALTKPEAVDTRSLYNYVLTQHDLLESFYQFKRRYEFILVPLSTAIGVFLIFRLWVPGGAVEHPVGAMTTFCLTVASCAAAIHAENRKNFREPLQNLYQLLQEFKQA